MVLWLLFAYASLSAIYLESKRFRLCVSISTQYLHTPSYPSEKRCGEFDRCSGQHPSHQVQAQEACNQLWIEFQWFDRLTGHTLQYFPSKPSEIYSGRTLPTQEAAVWGMQPRNSLSLGFKARQPSNWAKTFAQSVKFEKCCLFLSFKLLIHFMSFAILILGACHCTRSKEHRLEVQASLHDHGQGTSLCGTFKGKLRLTCNPAKKTNETLTHLKR